MRSKPADVLVAVPPVRELPVENPGEPAAVHHVVAGAEVAMHEAELADGRRMRTEPCQYVLERRPGLACTVQGAPVFCHFDSRRGDQGYGQ